DQRKRRRAASADGAEENYVSLATLGPRRVPLPAGGRNGQRLERCDLLGRAYSEGAESRYREPRRTWPGHVRTHGGREMTRKNTAASFAYFAAQTLCLGVEVRGFRVTRKCLDGGNGRER